MAENIYGSGMLSPNQAPPKANITNQEQDPTEEQKELAKQIDKLFEKAAKNRKKYDASWLDNYKMFRGQQWLKGRPSYKNKEVINLIFETIMSQTSVMLDTRPQVGFVARSPEDIPFAEVLSQLFQAEWDKNNWLDEIAQVILDSHIYSVGFSYCSYDESANDHMGGVEFCCEDPLDFYPDPKATNVNKKGEYFIVAKPMDIDEVKKKWSNSPFIEQIKPDLEDLNAYNKRQSELILKRVNTDLDTQPWRSISGANEDDQMKDKVLVLTAYLKPSDIEHIEQEDVDADGEKVYITRLKYPKGRKVVKIGHYILEDGPLPFDDLEFPFQRLVNYALPREFYGISELDNTKGPQIVFNKLINFSLDVLTLMGNPIWKVPTEGNVNVRKLINQPGLIVEYANGSVGEPRREEGVQLQPYVLDMIDRMEKWFNDIAGTQDVTRGINPTGVTASSAIEQLMDAASKRVKQKMRNLDSYIRDFGRQWVSRVMQFYSTPQVYRMTNKENISQYFKFNVENRPAVDHMGQPVMDALGAQKNQKFAIVKKAFKNKDGQMQYEETPSEYEIKGDFDISVNTVSGLPFKKVENEQRMFALFDRGIVDGQEVLDKIDYPNKEVVLQRVKEEKAQEAQAQQQQPSQQQGAQGMAQAPQDPAAAQDPGQAPAGGEDQGADQFTQLVTNLNDGLSMLAQLAQQADPQVAQALAQVQQGFQQAVGQLAQKMGGAQPQGQGMAAPEQGASGSAKPAGPTYQFLSKPM